jgi:hypothetical protein
VLNSRATILLAALLIVPELGCSTSCGAGKSCGTLIVACQTHLVTDYTTRPEPWAHAYVSVSSLDSKLSRRVQADSLGLVTFKRLPAGTYSVRIDYRANPLPDEPFARDTLVVHRQDTTRVTLGLEEVDLMTPEGPYGEVRRWKP